MSRESMPSPYRSSERSSRLSPWRFLTIALLGTLFLLPMYQASQVKAVNEIKTASLVKCFANIDVDYQDGDIPIGNEDPLDEVYDELTKTLLTPEEKITEAQHVQSDNWQTPPQASESVIEKQLGADYLDAAFMSEVGYFDPSGSWHSLVGGTSYLVGHTIRSQKPVWIFTFPNHGLEDSVTEHFEEGLQLGFSFVGINEQNGQLDMLGQAGNISKCKKIISSRGQHVATLLEVEGPPGVSINGYPDRGIEWRPYPIAGLGGPCTLSGPLKAVSFPASTNTIREPLFVEIEPPFLFGRGKWAVNLNGPEYLLTAGIGNGGSSGGLFRDKSGKVCAMHNYGANFGEFGTVGLNVLPDNQTMQKLVTDFMLYP